MVRVLDQGLTGGKWGGQGNALSWGKPPSLGMGMAIVLRGSSTGLLFLFCSDRSIVRTSHVLHRDILYTMVVLWDYNGDEKFLWPSTFLFLLYI